MLTGSKYIVHEYLFPACIKSTPFFHPDMHTENENISKQIQWLGFEFKQTLTIKHQKLNFNNFTLNKMINVKN